MSAIAWHISDKMLVALRAIRDHAEGSPLPVVPREAQRALIRRRMITARGELTVYGSACVLFLDYAAVEEALEGEAKPSPSKNHLDSAIEIAGAIGDATS